MLSGCCRYESAGSDSGSAALGTLFGYDWRDQFKCYTWFSGCNPNRVASDYVGATRTGLHPNARYWSEPGLILDWARSRSGVSQVSFWSEPGLVLRHFSTCASRGRSLLGVQATYSDTLHGRWTWYDDKISNQHAGWTNKNSNQHAKWTL